MHVINSLEVLKLLQVLLVSSVKFLFGPLVSLGYGFNYLETMVITTMGGVLGLLFFFFLSKWLIRQLNLYIPLLVASFRSKVQQEKMVLAKREKAPKRRFNWRNRLIINIRDKYGYIGIILLTPVLLSIPIGVFLAQKYYSRKSHTLVYLSLSVAFWSFFISSFVFLVR